MHGVSFCRDLFDNRLVAMVSACCLDPVNCDGGLSESCDYNCGKLFVPFVQDCGDVLRSLDAYDEAQALDYQAHHVRCLQLDPKSTVMAIHNSVCQVCGDQIISGEEECDDGDGINSQEPNANCRTNCILKRCGDGIIDDGEECDNGPANAVEGTIITEGCSATCSLPQNDCGSAQGSPGESCAEIHANCATEPSGIFWVDPNGGASDPTGPDASDAFQVYCDMENDDGGWTLVATVGTANDLPFMTDYLTGDPLDPTHRQRTMHSHWDEIQGSDVRVGRMVGAGSTTGNIFEINDCGSDDAACWYTERLNQNDGDEFGHWVLHGASYWQSVPGGCGDDTCPARDGDRDHDASLRIAIWGGDCCSACTNANINGFQYTGYGCSAPPTWGSYRWFWSVETEQEGSTSLGPQQANANCDHNNPASCAFDESLSRHVWIR